ncbi:alpha/beta hydrolase family protein [Streptomyces milbemycinicus]|uniref:Alpha/beta hydrolase family protein n=1 Tax=Streptomyces milbemycinicus TaxID=476552 RepID=A0ABW8M6U7_9ACTN
MTATRTASPALWPLLATLRSRLSFRFSATGRAATALVTDGRGFLYGEFWDLGGVRPHCRVVPGLRYDADGGGHQLPNDAVPFDDGAVLLISSGELLFVSPDGRQRPAGLLPARPVVAAPAPDGSHAVFFVVRDASSDHCSAWWWPGPQAPVRRLGGLSPLLARGGGWLDPGADRYVLNVRDGARTVPSAYHLRTGECTALPIDPAGDDIAWYTAPHTGEVLLVSAVESEDEAHQLRLFRPGEPTRALSAPRSLSGTATPVAMHPGGGLVALHVVDTPHRSLVLLDTTADEIRPMKAAEPCVLGAGAWSEGLSGTSRLWTLSIGAGLPARMVAHDPDGWSEVRDGTQAGTSDAWAPSWAERLPGAEGEIEAIVCGHQDWRSARQVVMCLHGGPADRWALKFSQLFQVLADEGVTVIAPNPRGSVGYGDAFHGLIVGAWAGPDLEDVLALARHIHRSRRGGPVALYGASYGAFLALLAAGMAPTLWSEVVAVAPFLNGDRLYPEASSAVRAMIDRLGGRTVIVDAAGPRDVLAQLPHITAPLVVLHGEHDRTIPASQPQRLVSELGRLGRRPGADFHYLEVAAAGHAPLDGSAELHQAVARFLAHGEWAAPPAAGTCCAGPAPGGRTPTTT